MNDIFERVAEFNRRIGVTPGRPLRPLDPVEQEWLHGVLKEETKELTDAWELWKTNQALNDLQGTVACTDALVDLCIFAIGGLYRMGLDADEARACFHAVMDANFEKKAGQKAGREAEGVADAVKPEGWVGPEARMQEILARDEELT